MSSASEKLYNGCLRRKMPTIATKVKVREIIVHLPCLTSQDRENIEAKREICGNFDSMVLLLDCLKRRENWPEQFIEALEACEQTTLAAEIRDEYNQLKGTNNSNPSSPPTTVVRAHVHPAPSASHLSTPESAGNNVAAVAAAAEAPAPPQPDEASAPPQIDEKSAPPQIDEASAPLEPDEASVPPQIDEASAPPQIDEASAPPQIDEASAPPQIDEASAPPQIDEASAPPQIDEASAPPQIDEASAPPEPSEESALPESSDEPAPPEPSEESAPPEPSEESAPSEPAAQASPPLETPVQPQAPQSSPDKVPEAVSPPEPVPEPPQPNEVAPPPSTPPPSPATQHTQATATPPPQREINSHPEPEENSESDIQEVSGDGGVIPDQVSAGHCETPPQDSGPEQCETDAASRPDPLQKTTTDTTKLSPPQSPSLTQVNSDGSSFLTETPEKPPVQDTTTAAVLQPEETSEPPAAQVVESGLQTATAAIASTLPVAAEMDAPVCTDSTVCPSKPSQVISDQPQNHCSPDSPEPSSPQPPGNGEGLEESEAEPDAVTSAHLPACSAVISTAVTTASALPCQENGIALNHNEPEENHYESPSQVPEVLENRVRVSVEPANPNLDSQSSTPQAPIVNGEAAKEIPSAPALSNNATDAVLGVDALPSENHQPSEPAAVNISPEPKTLQDSQEKTASCTLPTNTKYILTAAGVGACALLMAWRFKN